MNLGACVNMNRNRLLSLVVCSTALLTGCFGDSPEQYLQAAHKALDEGKRGEAVIQLKNALQKNPQMAEARFLLAQALYDSGDVSGAEIELGKASDGGYSADKVKALRAKLMLAHGQADKVVSEFAQTQLASPPEMADLQASVATAYGQIGKAPEALQAIDASLKLDPANVRAQMIKVRLLAASARPDEALAAMNELSTKNEKNAEVWRAKGELLVGMQKIDEAIEAYRRAISINKKSVDAHAGVFALLIQKRDIAGAEAELKSMREVAPKHPLTVLDTAVLALEQNDLKTAREAVQRVLKAAPEDPRVLTLAGQIELRRGELLEAEANFSKVLTANPNNAAARIFLARTQLRQGDTTKALAGLQPLLIDDGKHLNALELAAEICMQAGDTKQAEAYFTMIAKANPKDVRSRAALAMAAARAGKFDQGVAELRALSASDPGSTADFGLINLHMARKDYAQALADIAALQRKSPESALPMYLRGRVELARGDQAGAREAFEGALKTDAAYYPAVAALTAMDIAGKDYKSGEARLRAELSRQPKNLPANMGLIALRDQMGASKAELADMLSKVIDVLPNEPSPRLALIELQLKRKEARQALTVAQNAAAALPNNADVQAALGRAQMANGDFDQAAAAFNKQISLSPNSPQSYMPLAEMYAERKDRATAVKTLNRALNVKDDFLPAQIALATMAITGGDFPEARRIAQVIDKQRPGQSVGAGLLGDVEAAQKHWDAAAGFYRAALAKGPTTELALKTHESLSRSSKPAAAQAFATEWLAAHPGDSQFQAYLGGYALLQQDYARAEQIYQTVLQRQPENVVALNNMAWLLSRNNRAGALDMALKANKLAPNQPAFMDTLAEVHAKSGQFDKAIEVEKQAVELAPNAPAYRLSLSRYYIGGGHKDAARQELTRLVGLSDKLPEQQEAKKLLATL